MKQSEKMMVNTGVMMLAFAYEMNGYYPAAIAVGCISLVMAVMTHSGNSFIDCLPKAVLFTFLSLFACILVGWMPTKIFGYLLFVNHVYALLWSQSSFKAIRVTVRMIFLSYLSFSFIALFFSPLVLGKFNWQAVLFAITRIQCMDVPMLLGYLNKWLKCIRKSLVKKAYRPIIMRNTEGMYDKLAGEMLYQK